MILVEWVSEDDFDNYCNDPELADLHPSRKRHLRLIWHLFDKLEDLRSIFK